MQLTITEKNVKAVNTHELLQQLKKIERKINNRQQCFHPNILDELVAEKEIIKDTLIKRGKGELLIEQLTLKGVLPSKAEYKKIVISKLDDYFETLEKIKTNEKKLKEGFDIIFPFGVASYSENSRGYSEYISSTEQAVIQPIDKLEDLKREIESLKEHARQVERAINQLNSREKQYILKKYSKRPRPLDQFIMQELKVSKSTYYESIVGPAMLKLAESLRII